jgi:hypothetical protein
VMTRVQAQAKAQAKTSLRRFFERSALVIDFDFDTPVFRAASGSVVRFYRP